MTMALFSVHQKVSSVVKAVDFSVPVMKILRYKDLMFHFFENIVRKRSSREKGI
jgi:hypothetical protein